MTEEELRAIPWVVFLCGVGFIGLLMTVAMLISDPWGVIAPVAIAAPAVLIGWHFRVPT